MTSTVQRHHSVPSSNSPPIAEWANHYWYVLRASALQANENLSDDAVRQLVQAFESYGITTPCQNCRGHYVEDWSSFPFTAEHARSLPNAIKWVEDLRTRIDARVKKQPLKQAVVQTKSNPAITSQETALQSMLRGSRSTVTVPFVPKPAAPLRVQNIFTRGMVGIPSKLTLSRASVEAAAEIKKNRESASRLLRSHRTSDVTADAMKRNLAIQSAVKETRANHAGPRGCNCGRR